MKQNTYAFTKNEKRYVWDIPNLWELSEEFPRFDFELTAFNALDEDIWYCGVNIPTVRSVYEHCLRISSADLSYAIMLDSNNTVLDGVHRILKAKTLGQKTVRAVRFEIMPEPDWIEDWPVS